MVLSTIHDYHPTRYIRYDRTARPNGPCYKSTRQSPTATGAQGSHTPFIATDEILCERPGALRAYPLSNFPYAQDPEDPSTYPTDDLPTLATYPRPATVGYVVDIDPHYPVPPSSVPYV